MRIHQEIISTNQSIARETIYFIFVPQYIRQPINISPDGEKNVGAEWEAEYEIKLRFCVQDTEYQS